MSPRPPRIQQIDLSYTLLGDLLTGRQRLTLLPEDARVVALYDEPKRQSVTILLEAETFPETPEGVHLYRLDAGPMP